MYSTIQTFKMLIGAGLLMGTIQFSRAQKAPHRPILGRFYGDIQLTNNGISLVPTFSLGHPALLFDLKFVRGRHSFEPDMRFAQEGKPWAFLFRYRYQAVEKGKFSLRTGMHPAVNFRTETDIRDGQQEDLMEARRYLAFEAAPGYSLSERVRVGVYYLTAFGFDEGVKRTHFPTLNAGFSDISLGKRLYAGVSPQVYYLRMDDEDGLYATAAVSLRLREFPLSLSTVLNQEIDSEIDRENFN